MGPTHDRFGPMKTVHQTVLIGLTDRVYTALGLAIQNTLIAAFESFYYFGLEN